MFVVYAENGFGRPCISAHPPLQAVISHGLRSEREQALRQWWRRTTDGDFNESYWCQQTMVGMVHVKAGVRNQMMLVMWAWILRWLRLRLAQPDCGLDPAAYHALMNSFERLALTVQSLTAESYTDSYLTTLSRVTGFRRALLARMVTTEIDPLLAETRQQLQAIR